MQSVCQWLAGEVHVAKLVMLFCRCRCSVRTSGRRRLVVHLGRSEIDIKANSAQLKLELGLSLAKIFTIDIVSFIRYSFKPA